MTQGGGEQMPLPSLPPSPLKYIPGYHGGDTEFIMDTGYSHELKEL